MAGTLETELHNITADNVVFCYRQGDSESLEVAEYYSTARGLPSDQLIPLSCSADNSISESDFVNTIEQPLLSALGNFQGASSAGGTGGERAIWVVILGFHVPNVYVRDSDNANIAIASRLHRLSHVVDYKLKNFTYNRIGNWKYFDTDDADSITITAVIDGPTKDDAIALIDRSLDVDNQNFITGTIFIDPYGKKTTTTQLDFQSDILDFVNNELSNLGLSSEVVVDTQDPYIDPIVSIFSRDAFYWGWFIPRYSKDLFLSQSDKRVFLYNADNDSAADITQSFDEVNGSDPWCNLAINISNPGYAACAGAVEDPGEDAYLRPRPFFEALHRGATLGEAFLYSSPFIDWKIFLIGDPLLVVNFPVALPTDQNISSVSQPNHEVIRQTKESLEEAVGYGARQTRLVQETLTYNVNSVNISEELKILPALAIWKDLKATPTRQFLFSLVLSSWSRYVETTTGLSVQEWLALRSEKTSSYLSNALALLGQGISSTYIHDEGHWQYDFVYTHSRNTLENVYFELQVSTEEDLTPLILNLDTEDSATGWKFESQPYIFIDMFEFGYPSNFSGFRVRFDSPVINYLITTEVYYVRWRAKAVDGSILSDWSTVERIIIKR